MTHPVKPAPVQQKRLLLITDSVISGLPVGLFDSTGLTCIKKIPVEKQLVNIDLFEQEFPYTDYVIISAGINDLSRCGQTGESLASFITDKIRQWHVKYPKTVFIYNSMILTDRPWLNKRLEIVNRAMFDLSIELYDLNYWFLDTHAAFMKVRGQFPIISPKGNGIHISHKACQYISHIIVDAITAYFKNCPTTPRIWPLRSEFRRLVAGPLHPHRREREPVIGRRNLGSRY